MEFKLDSKMIESLKDYSILLNKESSTILKEALEEYFVKIEKELMEKNLEKENALTTFSAEEFWSGIEDFE